MGLFFIQNGRLFAQHGLSGAQRATGPTRMHAMRKSQVDYVDIGVGNQRVISRIAVVVDRGMAMRSIDRKRSGNSSTCAGVRPAAATSRAPSTFLSDDANR